MNGFVPLFLLSTLSGMTVFFVLVSLDRHRSQKKSWLKLPFFVAAGAFSLVPGAFLYELSSLWFTVTDQSSWERILFFWSVNAPVEEITKFGCFWGTTLLLRSIKEPYDGALQGAAVGLGFGLVENALYAASGGWELLVVRIVVSLPGHVIYGSVWGGYYGFEFFQGEGRIRRPFVLFLALVPAVFAHALFNTLAELQVPLVANLSVDVLALFFGVFLFWNLRTASPYESRWPLKKWADAVPTLQTAVKLNPGSSALRLRLAAYLLAARRPNEALKYLDEISSQEADVCFYKAAAYSQRGDSELSRALYDQFRERAGESQTKKLTSEWNFLKRK